MGTDLNYSPSQKWALGRLVDFSGCGRPAPVTELDGSSFFQTIHHSFSCSCAQTLLLNDFFSSVTRN
jgi:hypothetical protein